MTSDTVPNFATVPQDSVSPSPPFGRRAYGHQRRRSPQTLACHIAESILTHRNLGQDRDISGYTTDPDLQALVQAQLDAD